MGNIRCRLSGILGDRRVTQKSLIKKTGLSSYTINKLYNENWDAVAKSTLIKLCEALEVDVGDLFQYAPIPNKSAKKDKKRKNKE